MHPRTDRPDTQRERPVGPRHAPPPSRPQPATAGPAGVLAASRERLAPEGAVTLAAPPARPQLPDPAGGRLREHLEAVRLHAQGAASWLETSSHYARLVNRDGVVPVTARFSARDLAFLAEAREEMLGFAELGLRLIQLHHPLDAGGVSSDTSAPVLRCRSCMWRWPCPTFRTLAEVLDGIRPGLPARPAEP
jgi:hypothetical protein